MLRGTLSEWIRWVILTSRNLFTLSSIPRKLPYTLLKNVWLRFYARTLPVAIEAPQLGIMSVNLTVNHPNILVWVIHEQNWITQVDWTSVLNVDFMIVNKEMKNSDVGVFLRGNRVKARYICSQCYTEIDKISHIFTGPLWVFFPLNSLTKHCEVAPHVQTTWHSGPIRDELSRAQGVRLTVLFSRHLFLGDV